MDLIAVDGHVLLSPAEAVTPRGPNSPAFKN
jgi:hypothetical protein